MQIKKITTAEYQLAAGLFNKYRIFYEQAPDINLAEGFIKERLRNNESVIFVAMTDDGDVPVGFTQLYPLISSVRAVKNWLLNDLFVEAAYRRQGVGEALISAAMEFAKQGNAKYLQLETAADNYNAQHLYETIGFEKQELGHDYFIYKKTII